MNETNLNEDFQTTEETFFINADNLRLYKQIWYPANKNDVRAMVFIIHGLNEHSSFYYEEAVVLPLLKIGCMVVSHDHVGHGRSEGNRRYVGKIDNLARDVIMHIEDIRKKTKICETIPIFLYGHSLGGLIACMISLERPELIAGMVLESPALTVHDKAGSSWFSFLAARALSIIIPSYVLRKPVFENLSRNPHLVLKASEDNYRNKDGLTLGTAVNISLAIFNIKSKLKDIKTPFFVAHGDKDCVVSVVASEILHNEASTKDKSFQLYNNAFHLLRGDVENVGEDFKLRTVQWIQSHIK